MKYVALAGTIALLASCGNESVSTLDAVIPITTESEARLGFGIDPIYEQNYENCVEFDDGVVSEDSHSESTFNSGAPSLKLDQRQITTHKEVDRFLNASISGSFSYLGATGSFSTSYENRFDLDSDNLTIGIEAIADYGRFYLKNVRIKPEYAALSDKEFERRCGREYISGYRLGQGVYILMSLSESTLETYEKITADFDASKGGNTIESNFVKSAELLSKYGQLTVAARVFGGGDVASLSALLANSKDAEKFMTQIESYLKKMKKSQAVRTKYLTSAYPGRPNDISAVTFQSYKKETLTDLYSDYRKVMTSLSRVRSYIREGGPALRRYFGSRLCQVSESSRGPNCNEYISALNTLKDDLEEAVAVINKHASNCIAARQTSECKTPDVETLNVYDLTIIRWPGQYKKVLLDQLLGSL
ncbi:hypothetical protein [Pseudobacteriovorax antillogorgiicola]|uniref:MAC/Perforin domain-containing protein n=1 Tax=Pseudobacteriovorax antillogorgiicola TaxID=1513793 RepID=A0A1Y6BAU2_9BACT|nr:hypothetical protein [Pseudobacteriovorax antillogorgiicola]TCS58492.1 hypothetical protein EDD56_1025 [Pseudobacteriovorax antillogorgiicola]SME98277.1 hypothetical protein SAMN06296036_102438 [Pseudobacteriovorax antillogorgiicola]